MKRTTIFCMLFQVFIAPVVVLGMNANPLISRNKTVYTSSGNVNYLTDNAFKTTTFSVSSNTWLAINLGNAYNKVFFTWNNPNYTWSDAISSVTNCKQSPSVPVNYTVQYSSNSSNGSDGTWNVAETVTGNIVTARGHVVDLKGAKWVKMVINNGSGPLDELEVFDLGRQGEDLWFFPGTSISANTFKSTVPAQNYADLIKQSFPSFNPAMIRGGIPCINSTQFKNDVSKYLAVAGNVKYWAIEMGTNDAWGGTNGGVSTFKANMQAVITACKNVGIQPIIARTLATSSSKAGWQVHADYLKAIDDLTATNNLIAGPDLYTWFLNHASDLDNDGVHPNAAGAASIQKLWAGKMATLYTATGLTLEDMAENNVVVYPNPFADAFEIQCEGTFEYVLQNAQGQTLQTGTAQDRTSLGHTYTPGVYMVILRQNNRERWVKIIKN